MRKLSKTEKLMLTLSPNEYINYYCPDHRLYRIRKEVSADKHVCPYCNKSNPEYKEV